MDKRVIEGSDKPNVADEMMPLWRYVISKMMWRLNVIARDDRFSTILDRLRPCSGPVHVSEKERGA
jgi:hypothetical protein